ncbi:MAG: 23S rRNA (pseudouridine(1915)-N(3))-methyltransferase RlmH [Sandaracinaceae bacterium]|nr:23S rRNA (pseudouridine(1915)-N(3))-methyltransferase RlmH [Sandaracinaceae bacterium]MBK7775563.1 23S rRNA (pseudouridine(1915)-N(3))-methyltransferase RlmH [Sandaracinaceae bacterium]MBK8406460.1 23S rRNA (pseudouridine(1915)-N(3))-methyltransferase RlmH [Sandaracinaceae bacterium]
MRVRIIAVGKIKEKPTQELLRDYYGRIDRYARFDEVELKDGTEEEVTERFERALPERSRVVALEVLGQRWSSDQLAQHLGRCEGEGVQSAVFLIGGSYGLPKVISKRADVQLSLSAMTLPHRLARLLLAEQVYRGFTILRNEPYSH